MIYLLDANCLIRAHEDYYPLDRVPQFWEWLLNEAADGNAKMPFEIHDEIASANGPLRDWIVQNEVIENLVLDEEVDIVMYNRVLSEAYAPDLNDAELEEAGRDPFLITYALMGAQRTVVTKEVSKRSRTRGRRKVPDACDDLGVPWMDDFSFYRIRDFRIR